MISLIVVNNYLYSSVYTVVFEFNATRDTVIVNVNIIHLLSVVFYLHVFNFLFN